MSAEMGGQQIYFNGINGDSGEYDLPPMTGEELFGFIQGESPAENLNELRFRYRQTTATHLGVKEGIDPTKLEATGWGIIFAHDADPRVKEALSELIDLRREQTGDTFKIYEGPDGFRRGSDAKPKWLARHGAGPGPADPEKVPYYLLLVGSPEAIPYRFQSQLDVQYAVGRIHFDTLQEYANYARSVVDSESGKVRLSRDVAFFGVANVDDRATQLSVKELVEPLRDQLATATGSWTYKSFMREQATKAQLSSLLGGEQTPALLFTASHGMSFPAGSPRQHDHQGALLCQDWPGPDAWRESIPQDFYFAGDDLTSDTNMLGQIAFFFASYSGGTPLNDEFAKQVFRDRSAIAPHPFLAQLPVKMLGLPRGGALAAIGHIERAWSYSFSWPDAGAQTTVYEATMQRLLNGHPVGSAIEYFNERYAEIATLLSDELEELEFGKRADPYEMARLWTANNDARGYAVIGDPAVRLPVVEAGEDGAERPMITVRQITGEIDSTATGQEKAAGETEAVAAEEKEEIGIILFFESEAAGLRDRVLRELDPIGYSIARPQNWSDAKENSDNWLPTITGGENAIFYGVEMEQIAHNIQQAMQKLDPPVHLELFAEGPKWSEGQQSHELNPGDMYILLVGEVFPVEYREQFNISDSANQVLENTMTRLASPNMPLITTGDLLLAGMAYSGTLENAGGTPYFFADYLHQVVPDLNIEDEINQTSSRSRERTLAKLLRQNPVQFSAEMASVLRRAQEYAIKTGNSGQIFARHLLAALLFESPDSPPNDARQWLSEKGISRNALGEAFIAYMQRHAIPLADWNRILLGEATEVSQLIGYSPDNVRQDKDLIGIDRQVTAFARLIAARTVPPPLAIGLFGEWGSGKTFFMRMLRKKIDELAVWASKQKKRQRDLPYYKRIVQIEFNAWQYIEGNLWASLVQHILDNLSIAGQPERSASEKLRDELIEKLGHEEREQKRAKEVEKEACRALIASRRELRKIRRDIQNTSDELAATAAEQAMRNFAIDSLKEPVNELLDQLGLQPVDNSARELELALDEAQDVLVKGRGLLTPLLRAEDRDDRFRRLIAIVFGSLFVGILASFFFTWLNDTFEQQISQTMAALGTSAATLLSTGAAWIRKQASWVNDRLTKIADQRQKLEKAISAELQVKTEEANRLEQRLQTLNVELSAAQRKNEAAQQRVLSARSELARATSASLLEGFVKSRAESNVYRDHLGIPAIIRQDFETISSLMEEENWKLAPQSPDDDKVLWKEKKKYANLEEEEAEEDVRINRIVLYIDDLDRCPPNRVVDVLQAIHLMLAFPLFVVVVGVDARWITRSLETRYRELLHTEDGLGSDLQMEELFGKATTDDYLEKIFQIPYWLRPMDKSAVQNMIRGLLPIREVKTSEQNDLRWPGESETEVDRLEANAGEEEQLKVVDRNGEEELEDSGSQEAEIQANEPEVESEVELDEQELDSEKVEAELSSAEVADELVTEEHNEQILDEVDGEAYLPAEDEDPNPEVLDIGPEERAFIEKLGPLLGRSPRALKRFINVYRLIKAGLTSYQHRLFLREHRVMSNFQAVLLLLAIDTGVPDIGADFFEMLRDEAEKNREILGSRKTDVPSVKLNDFPSLISQLDDVYTSKKGTQDTSFTVRQQEDWSKLKSWLLSVQDNSGMPMEKSMVELVFLDDWARRVARHSFRVNYQ